MQGNEKSCLSLLASQPFLISVSLGPKEWLRLDNKEDSD